MRYRYFEAFYGFPLSQPHIAVARSARAALIGLARELLNSEELIAIYVPKSAEPAYPAARGLGGRVVGSVRLVPKPQGRDITDYYYEDPVTGDKRWPVGWPCAVVDAPPPERQPLLRDLVAEVYKGKPDFSAYAKQFQNGPFRIHPDMSAAIARRFQG